MARVVLRDRGGEGRKEGYGDGLGDIWGHGLRFANIIIHEEAWEPESVTLSGTTPPGRALLPTALRRWKRGNRRRRAAGKRREPSPRKLLA